MNNYYPYSASENLILITNGKNELFEWSNANKIINNISRINRNLKLFEKIILSEEYFDPEINANMNLFNYQIIDISISATHILLLIAEINIEKKFDNKLFKGTSEKDYWKIYLEEFIYKQSERIFICTILSKEVDKMLLAKFFIDKFEHSTLYSPDFPIIKPYFHKVCCGNNFSLAIDSNGRLFGWGNGEICCINKEVNKFIELPNEIFVLDGEEKVVFKEVKAGCNFVLVLDNKGNLWSWGQNDYNQLGYKTEKNRKSTKPNKIYFPKSVKSFSCGLYHAICMIDGSIVYSWGQNNNGQLGLGNFKKHEEPEIIYNLKGDHIKNFSCGINNTACVNRNGVYCSWGNNSFGKLGIEDTRIEDFGKNFTIPHYFSLGIEGNFEIGEIMEEVKLLNNFSIGKTNYGNYYAWGKVDWLMNGDEVVNLNPNYIVDGFKIVQILKYKNENLENLKESTKIEDIVTGLNNTIGLTDIGEIYIWGSNLKYQHGCNKDKITKIYKDLLNKYKIEKGEKIYPVESLPHLNDFFSVKNNRKVTNISIGYNHILAVEREYAIYSWGCNKYGQLGIDNLNKDEYTKVPERIKDISGSKFKRVWAAGDQSYALTENGDLYSWGNSSEGKLGLGNLINKENIYKPEKVIMPPIFDIFVGERHCFILCKLKEDKLYLETYINVEKNENVQDKMLIFSFGCNESGQLGIKNRINQFKPALIEFNKKIKQISCGYDVSGFLTEDKKLYLFGNLNNLFLGLKNNTEFNENKDFIKDDAIVFPIEINLSSFKINDKLEGIYLSKNYNVIHLENKRGYYWGNFKKSQTALNELKKNGNIFYFDKISINQYHCVCISLDNNLYSWGYDNYTGRLGNLINISSSKYKTNITKKILKKVIVDHLIPKKIKILKIFLIENSNNKNIKKRTLIKEETQSFDPNRSNSELTNSNLKKSEININVSFDKKKIEIDNLNIDLVLNDEYLNSIFNISIASFQKILKKIKKVKDIFYKKKEILNVIKKKALIRLKEEPFSFNFINKDRKLFNIDPEFYFNKNEFKLIFSYFYMHPCLMIDLVKTRIFNKNDFSKLVISVFKGILFNYKYECYFMIFMNKLFDYENSIEIDKKDINIYSKYMIQNNITNSKYLENYIKLFKYYIKNDIKLKSIYKEIYKLIIKEIIDKSKNQTHLNKPYSFCFFETDELNKIYKEELKAWKNSDFEDRSERLKDLFQIVYEKLKSLMCQANLLKDTTKLIIFYFHKKTNSKTINNYKNNIILQIIFYPLIELIDYKSKKEGEKNKNFRYNLQSINQLFISLITGNTIRINNDETPWVSKINKLLNDRKKFRKEIYEQIINKENFEFRDNYFENKFGKENGKDYEIKNNLQLDERMIFLYFLEILKLSEEYITVDRNILIKLVFSIKKINNEKNIKIFKFQEIYKELYQRLSKNDTFNYYKLFPLLSDYNNEKDNDKLKKFNIKLIVQEILIKNYLKCKRCSKCRIITLENLICIRNVENIIPRFQEPKKNNGIYYWFNFLDSIKINRDLFNKFKNNSNLFNIKKLTEELNTNHNIKQRKCIIDLINYISKILKKKIIKFNEKDFFVNNENNNHIILKQKHNTLNKKLEREIYRRYSYQQNILNISFLCDFYLKNLIKTKIRKLEKELDSKGIYENDNKVSIYKKLELNISIGFSNWNWLKEFEKENKFVRRIIFQFNSKNIFKDIFKYLTRKEKLKIESKFIDKFQNLLKEGIIVNYKFQNLENSKEIDINFEDDLNDNFLIFITKKNHYYKQIISRFKLDSETIYKFIKSNLIDNEKEILIKNEKKDFIKFNFEKFFERYLKIFNSKNVYIILDYIIFKRKFI